MKDAYRVTLFLDRVDWQTIGRLARERAYREQKDLTPSALVREAIQEYLTRHGKRGRR